jgi:hypothetical protein
MTDYVTVAEALAIHADQIERYGGSAGVRDQGLLEGALFRPQTGYYRSLTEEAAALWESLSQNHPFVDWQQANGLRHYLYLPCYQWRPPDSERQRKRDVSSQSQRNRYIRFCAAEPMAARECGIRRKRIEPPR